MYLIISDLRWLVLFSVICRMQIRWSGLHRQLQATLSMIISKHIKKEKKKKVIQDVYASIY